MQSYILKYFSPYLFGPVKSTVLFNNPLLTMAFLEHPLGTASSGRRRHVTPNHEDLAFREEPGPEVTRYYQFVFQTQEEYSEHGC